MLNSPEDMVFNYLKQWFIDNKDNPRRFSDNKIGSLLKKELNRTNNFKCQSRGKPKEGWKARLKQMETEGVKIEIKETIKTKPINSSYLEENTAI